MYFSLAVALHLLGMFLFSEVSSATKEALEVGPLFFPMSSVNLTLKDTVKGLFRPLVEFKALSIQPFSISNWTSLNYQENQVSYNIEYSKPKWFTINSRGFVYLNNEVLDDIQGFEEAMVKVKANLADQFAYAVLNLRIHKLNYLDCNQLDHDHYCFWDSVKYQIYEESKAAKIGQIGRGPPFECNMFIYKYTLTEGDDKFDVNNTYPGASLLSVSRIDRERLRTQNPKDTPNPIRIGIECNVYKKDQGLVTTKFRNLFVQVLDMDDNLPLLEKNKKLFVNDSHLTPGHWWDATTLLDLDSPSVNSYFLNASDSKNIFEYKIQKVTLPNERTQIILRMKAKENRPLPFDAYPISLNIIDKNYPGRNQQTTGRIWLHYNFKPKYPSSILLQRHAVDIYSRVASPTNYDANLLLNELKPNYIFSLKGNYSDAFAITYLGGIIYVVNETLLDSLPSKVELEVTWKREKPKKNNLESNSTLILVELINYMGPCINTKSRHRCQAIISKKVCLDSCGIAVAAANNGTCRWFMESKQQFSTCTVHSTTCPDDVCDPLESLNINICPLDCIKNRYNVSFGPRNVCSCKNDVTCTCVVTGNEGREEHKSTTSQGIDCGLTCWSAIISMIVLAFIILWILRRFIIWKRINTKTLAVETSTVATTTEPMPPMVIDYTSTDDMSRSLMNDFLGPKWEFPRERLTIEETLGEGEFGIVMRATARDIAGVPGLTTVAVKTVKPGASTSELQDLLSEYQLLKDVSHPHVVRLMGASTTPPGPVYLILEYCCHGSLSSYLRKIRNHGEAGLLTEEEMCSPKEIISFAWHICKGMTYLSDIKLVHRDLAARNILLAEGKICKISDFGLTRDIYVDDTYLKSSKGRVPVKWMAVESLTDHIYTCRSDVWSFGIVLWELVTLGATPYPGIAMGNLYNFLKAGYRMEKPINCSDQLYEIMLNCWKANPHARPKFRELTATFERMLEEGNDYLNLNINIVFNKSYFDMDSTIGDSTSEHVVTSYRLSGPGDNCPSDSHRLLENNHTEEGYVTPIRLPRPSTSMIS